MKYYFSAIAILFSCVLLQAQTVIISGFDMHSNVIDLTGKSQAVPDSSKNSKYQPFYGDNAPSHKVFTISSDLTQYFICQPNIDFAIRVLRKEEIGLNIGIVEPCLLFAQNPLASEQYTDPGTVYKGIATRLYFKFYPGVAHKSYWELQLVYKKLSYTSTGFSDDYENSSVLNTYNMNEQESVYGIELMHGNELTKENQHINIDFFYGAGFHERVRNYQVTSQEIFIAPGADLQNLAMATPGSYSGTLSLFTPVIGLRFGWNYLKRN